MYAMNEKVKIRDVIKEKWKPYIVFAILAFALYGNTLNHSFVYDDSMVLTQNRFTQQGIKGIPDLLKYDTFTGIMLIFNDEFTADLLKENMNIVAGGRYRPLSPVTFALEIELFGQQHNSKVFGPYRGNALVSHLFNIILYLFTACLLFLILNHLFPSGQDKKWYLSFPFLATLLFVAHPIHTEVVANIKSRDEIMALLGSLSALWFTIKYVETNKYLNLTLSGLCLFLGLLSKENAITFLAVIPVTIHYFVTKRPKTLLIAMLPLMVVSVLFLSIRASVIGHAHTANISELMNNPFAGSTTGETLATIFMTLLIYVKLLLFPHPLTSDYYPHHIEIINWSNPVALLSLLFYVVIGIYAVYGLIKKRNVCSWSIWLYLIPLSVVSNLFFPVGVFMGERFIFFSSTGFAIFTGWLIYTYIPKLSNLFPDYLSRFGGDEKRSMQLSACFSGIVMGILLSLYAVKTINRNAVWKDNFTLFTTDVKTSKNSAKANYEAGTACFLKALYPENNKETQLRNVYRKDAERYLKNAIQLHPQYSSAFEQLGSLYLHCYGDIAQALHCYAVSLYRPTMRSHAITNVAKEMLNATNFLLDEDLVTSTPEDIIKSCDEILKMIPDMGEAFFAKGVVYGKYLNNLELALSNLEQALSMDFPKTVKFYEYLGAAYGFSGDDPHAVQYLLKAVEMGTDDCKTYINLGVIYQRLGDMENANLYTSKGNEMKNNISK